MKFRNARPSDAPILAAISIEVWLGTYIKNGLNSFFAEFALSEFTSVKLAALLEVSDVSAHGTVLRDCVAEGLRFIFTPDGVEDDEETRDNEGPCRAGCEGHSARDAQIAFF